MCMCVILVSVTGDEVWRPDVTSVPMSLNPGKLHQKRLEIGTLTAWYVQIQSRTSISIHESQSRELLSVFIDLAL